MNLINFLHKFYSNYNKIFTDKIKPKKIRERDQQSSTVPDKLEKTPSVFSGAVASLNNFLAQQDPPQPKIDATDRRQAEAIAEDRYKSSKVTLDDAKYVAQKEKKKKENTYMESCPTGNYSGGGVSKIWIYQY